MQSVEDVNLTSPQNCCREEELKPLDCPGSYACWHWTWWTGCEDVLLSPAIHWQTSTVFISLLFYNCCVIVSSGDARPLRDPLFTNTGHMFQEVIGKSLRLFHKRRGWENRAAAAQPTQPITGTLPYVLRSFYFLDLASQVMLDAQRHG